MFDYLNYRSYFRDLLEVRRLLNPSYSLGMLSRQPGAPSKAFLSLLMSGKRDASTRKAAALGKVLGLEGPALAYFEALVRFNQCGQAHEKEALLGRVISARPRKQQANFNIEHYLLLETWHCLAIRELVRHPRFREDPAHISRLLLGRVKPAEVKVALELLLRLGMLVRGPKGKLLAAQRILKTSDEVNAVAVRKYHKSCLQLACEVVEQAPSADRDLTSVNVTLSEKQFAALKAKLGKVREEISAMQTDVGEKSRLCQVNFQLLGLTEPA